MRVLLGAAVVASVACVNPSPLTCRTAADCRSGAAGEVCLPDGVGGGFCAGGAASGTSGGSSSSGGGSTSGGTTGPAPCQPNSETRYGGAVAAHALTTGSYEARVFGGIDSCLGGHLNGEAWTWTYSGGGWGSMPGVGGPLSTLQGANAFYDPISDKYYLVSGLDAMGTLNVELLRLDTPSWSVVLSDQLPIGRTSAGLASVPDAGFLLVGGYTSVLTHSCNGYLWDTTWIRPDNNPNCLADAGGNCGPVFSPGPPLNVPRTNAGVTFNPVDHLIYVAGGLGPQDAGFPDAAGSSCGMEPGTFDLDLDTVETLDPYADGGTWVVQPARLTRARHGLSLLADGTSLFAVGGAVKDLAFPTILYPYVPDSTNERLDTDAGWQQLLPIPIGTYAAQGVTGFTPGDFILISGLVYDGGFDRDAGPTVGNGYWLFDVNNLTPGTDGGGKWIHVTL